MSTTLSGQELSDKSQYWSEETRALAALDLAVQDRGSGKLGPRLQDFLKTIAANDELEVELLLSEVDARLKRRTRYEWLPKVFGRSGPVGNIPHRTPEKITLRSMWLP